MLLPVAADAYVAASCPIQNTYIFIRLRLRPRPPPPLLPFVRVVSNDGIIRQFRCCCRCCSQCRCCPSCCCPLLLLCLLLLPPLVVVPLVVVAAIIVAFGFSAGGVDWINYRHSRACIFKRATTFLHSFIISASCLPLPAAPTSISHSLSTFPQLRFFATEIAICACFVLIKLYMQFKCELSQQRPKQHFGQLPVWAC